MELQNIFAAVCNMTVTGSIVILCVLPARLALVKAPKIFSWALWLVVIFRLLCPVSISGPVSVLEIVDVPQIQTGITEDPQIYVSTPVASVPPAGEALPEAPPEPVTGKTPTDWSLIGPRVWAAVSFGLLAYGIISYVNLKRKLRESVPLGRGFREADGIASPFVLGRTIYLPSDLKAEERGYILLHEQLHLRHGDHIVKAVFWLAVCLHWFNPLVWLAFFLCGRDMELRCDEAVLKSLGPQVRSDYAQSLLNLATRRRFVPAPLAFGEGDTGKRVKHVLNWKRSKLWIAIPAAVLCTLVLVITVCDPAGKDTPFGHSYRSAHIRASSDNPAAIDGATVYTLTSDMGLFVRSDKTDLAGFFQKAPADWDAIPAMPEYMKDGDIRRSWHIEEGEWWLLELENDELWLFDGVQSVMYRLARTDLLGVSIKQPGIESYVEPVWFSSGGWSKLPDAMSTTLVNDGAQIVLMPELDADMILVSEEYYERMADGEYNITTTDYFLEPDRNGDFLLDVSRRGTVHDDFAQYYVTVGEDTYIFQLSFPAVPGETSYQSGVPERTREVRYAEGNAWITLQLPESWDYDITYLDDPELDAGISAGITFWPRGREEGKLFFGYYPNGFGVCGTGLETSGLVLAGQYASMGTYDGKKLWDFISFGEYFAVWGQGHEHWWAEYGDDAMEILDSAQFEAAPTDRYQKEMTLGDSVNNRQGSFPFSFGI